jgi:hypothetical protein|tara:strand:+ start:412 stop:741 length:330 start_codon:yes stop_codon:yes gene_type:complete
MTKRVKRSPDGKYHVAGKKYTLLKGSRAQVWHETAYKTAGGLKKSDLIMNKLGRVVSSKKHKTAKKEKRLEKHGYSMAKGKKFGAIKLDKSKAKSTRKKRTRKRLNKKR